MMDARHGEPGASLLETCLWLLSLFIYFCLTKSRKLQAESNANSEVAASLKGMIILFNILIIIIQGTFQRRHLTTEEKMTL